MERDAGVEVVNLGGGGLDSHDMLRIFEQLRDWPFETIFLYGGHNDFGNLWLDGRDEGLAARTRLVAQMEKSALYGLLARPTALTAELFMEDVRSRDVWITKAQRERALADLEANLRRMAWLAERRGSTLVLVTPVNDLLRPPVSGCPRPPCSRTSSISARRATRPWQRSSWGCCLVEDDRDDALNGVAERCTAM
jgi:hypothetical protein